MVIGRGKLNKTPTA